MKNAFTMIELIFVIVIIGILAAIAIPRLSASRDDAKTSKELNNLSVYLNDITTYYMATGNVSANHTNVKLNCFAPNVLIANQTLSLSVANGGSDDGKPYCDAAQKAAAKKGLEGTRLIVFGGALISY
ncbi:Type II secretion envelope pseudopilin protein (PulG,guides folded protein to PulD in outer membrane) [hydrothermal vent metagenome]|uniref:Type II secretion envelope pseudopilin protein (PulG,guides folded protein to PulD in outer membrane) n=1 Tax=hydrothermal vent metagenome TaxID=652676 RepID=A0A1W1CBP9_9ZZZZ